MRKKLWEWFKKFLRWLLLKLWEWFQKWRQPKIPPKP